MKRLRAGGRFVAFFGLTIALALVRLVCRRREWRGRLFRLWSRATLWLTGVQPTIHGAPPQPPFFLVCNHLSYVDIVILAGVVNARFIAKRELRHWPVLGPILALMETIFVDRTTRRDVARVNAEIASALDSGDGIVVFAEGTSTAGHAILPLRTSLLEIAAQRRQPVHYATLTYATPAVCWWGDAAFLPHFFDFLQRPGCTATLRFGPAPITGPDRKTLARELHAAMSAQFTPVR
jgi:1-acyl-sn-glycerol-3-phosphate acyltransferase